MSERCPRCGFRLERIAGHWIGALGMNTIVSFASVLVAIIIGFVMVYPDGDVGPALALIVGTAVVVPLVFFPVSKTLWSAIDLAMRPLAPDDDVDPRYIPASHRHEPP